MRSPIFFGLMAFATAQSMCAGVVTVTPSTGTTVTQVSPGVWDVVLNVPANASSSQTFIVRGAATDQIRNCFVNSQSALFTFVDIVGPTPGSSVGSLNQFNIGQSTGGVFLRELRTVGNVGFIRTNAIIQGFVGGNVVNNIEIVDSASLSTERIESLIVSGNLLASVTAEAGYIQRIEVTGTIGNSTFTRTISAPDRVENVLASAIFANISATGTTSGTGLIRRVETTAGSFNGSLTAREITGAFGTGTPGIAIVGGTLNAPVTIGRGLPAGASITVPANGLTKQVVINNLNDPSNLWSGSVTVGAQPALTVPNYSVTNAALGNGSVGLVPFRLHEQSSSPPNGYAPSPIPATALTNTRFAGTSLQGGPPVPVELEFYGPVALPTSGAPVKIVMLDTCVSPAPDVTNRFAYSVEGRRLKIQRNSAAGFPLDLAVPGRFQVTLPASGGLLCADVPGNVLVTPFTYTFQLFADCDNDGTPYNALTGALEGGCGSTGYCDTIDFNRNGVWPEAQDDIDFNSVLGGGPCSTGMCGDIDFNNNAVFPEDDDVTAWYNTLAGGCIICN